MNDRPTAGQKIQGRSYWRSMEDLHDSQEHRELEHGEHRSHDMPGALSRRTVLKLMTASISLAGLGLTSCRRPVEKIVPYVEPPERAVPGVPRYYATTMPLALSAYGLIVESHEGRPTKIEGNPRHPSTLGTSSSMIQAAILGLYDPDRSQTVLHDGTEKTWENFIASWRDLDQNHLETQGVHLAVLSESFSSPTFARLK